LGWFPKRPKEENMKLTNKLYVLRLFFIAVFYFVGLLPTRLKYPAKWILHYLLGSGKNLIIPKWIIREANQSINNALCWNDLKRRVGNWTQCCLSSSIVYEGYGFQNRPTLFYLVGGFTFRFKRLGKVKWVSIIDVYDWHSSVDREGDLRYFNSPIGNSLPIRIGVKLLRLFVGKESADVYFPIDGVHNISNALWHHLETVGAKPFNSTYIGRL
jgi:hypothetical protein